MHCHCTPLCGLIPSLVPEYWHDCILGSTLLQHFATLHVLHSNVGALSPCRWHSKLIMVRSGRVGNLTSSILLKWHAFWENLYEPSCSSPGISYQCCQWERKGVNGLEVIVSLTVHEASIKVVVDLIL